MAVIPIPQRQRKAPGPGHINNAPRLQQHERVALELELAWVAAGRFDAFWERGLKPWDIAAGIVLVREAGGIIEEIEGGDVMKTGNILAGNEDIVPGVMEQLRHAASFGRAAKV